MSCLGHVLSSPRPLRTPADQGIGLPTPPPFLRSRTFQVPTIPFPIPLMNLHLARVKREGPHSHFVHMTPA